MTTKTQSVAANVPRPTWILLILIGCANAWLGTAAHGQANSWTNTGFGKWETNSNWSLGVAPNSTQTATFITNAPSKTVTIDAITTASFPGTLTISNLTVSAPAASGNTLFLNMAGLGTPLHVLNSLTISSRGTLFVYSNSMVQIDGVTSSGSLIIDGGGFVHLLDGATLIATNLTTALGITGTGEMVVTDGTVQVSNLGVGYGVGSQGTLTLDESTAVMGADWWVGLSTGSKGAVWMSGGQLVANAFTDIGLSGSGQMTVSNGTVLGEAIFVGGNTGGAGTLTAVGGTINSGLGGGSFNALTAGDGVNSTGAVWITGGQLIATNSSSFPGGASVVIGKSGIGRLTLSNSTVNVGTVTIAQNAGSAGTFTMVGGTLVANRLVATNSTATIQFPSGIMTLHGAQIANGQSFLVGAAGQTAVLNLVGGTNRFATPFSPGPVANSTGTVWVTGGQLVVTNSATEVGGDGTGQMTVSNAAWLAHVVEVGAFSSSQGTLTLVDSTAASSNIFAVGAEDLTATGAVWLTRSQLTISNAPTYVGWFGVGQMAVSNSTWRGREAVVGYMAGSQGTLTLAGGTNTLSSFLSVGAAIGGTGTLWMTGGQLIITNSVIEVSESGCGQITISNGTCLIGGINLGDSGNAHGTLTIAGGTMTILADLNAGFGGTQTLWLTGGQLNVTNGLTSIGYFDTGRMIVSNGAWRTRNVIIGNMPGSVGTLTVAGGASSVYSNLAIGNSTCTITGAVLITGGELHVTNNPATAVLEVRSGTVIQTGGLLDVDRLIITNPCAHFIHTGGTLIYGILDLSTNQTADVDGDGMLNSYELSHGLDPLDPTDANLDYDGDGQSNFQEYTMGTDPFDPNSYFHISSIIVTNKDVLITWPTATMTGDGLSIEYYVQWGTNITTGVTNQLAFVFVFRGTPITSTNYLDVGGATNRPARFYRILGRPNIG